MPEIEKLSWKLSYKIRPRHKTASNANKAASRIHPGGTQVTPIFVYEGTERTVQRVDSETHSHTYATYFISALNTKVA